MIKAVFALIGTILVFTGAILGLLSTTMGTMWDLGTIRKTTLLEEIPVWHSFESAVGITPDQVFVLSIVGILAGMILVVPWWLERRQQENVWWEKRDGPLDTPPPAGM